MESAGSPTGGGVSRVGDLGASLLEKDDPARGREPNAASRAVFVRGRFAWGFAPGLETLAGTRGC